MAKEAASRAAALYGKGQQSASSGVNLPELARNYLPIVKHEVMRFRVRLPRHVDAEDLQGAAMSGLMRALERWDPVDAETFGGYVRKRVRGAILDELRRMDQFSRGVRRKARLYDDAVREIEQREGRVAREEDVRKHLGYSREAFADLLEELRPISFLSIDEIREESRGGGLAEELDDPNATAVQDTVESRELVELLRERLEQLPEKEQKILHMYYFLDFRLGEIAEAFGLSESRICQLHTHAIRGLRVYLGKHRQD